MEFVKIIKQQNPLMGVDMKKVKKDVKPARSLFIITDCIAHVVICE